MSTVVRVGSSPLVAPLFTFTFPHKTGTGEPSVGDVVFINSAGEAQQTDADGKLSVIGVVLSKSGGYVSVCMEGIVEVVANGAISVGARVMSSANGRVKAVPTAGATYSATDVENAKAVIGVALTGAASAGDKLLIALEVA